MTQNLTAAHGPRWDSSAKGGEPFAVGYKLWATVLSDEGYARLSQLMESEKQEDQVVATQKLFKEHPEYLKHVKVDTVNEEGYYTLRFDSLDGACTNMKHIYMWVTNKDGEVVPSYSNLVKTPFIAPNNVVIGSWRTSSLEGAVVR